MKKIGFVIGPQGFRWQDTYYDKFQKNKTLRPWLESVPSKYFIDEGGRKWKPGSAEAPYVRIDVAVGYGLKYALAKNHKTIAFDIIPASELTSKRVSGYDLVINQFLDGLIVPFLKRFEGSDGAPHARLMSLYHKHADKMYPPMDYHKLIMNKCDYYDFLNKIGESVLPTLCVRREDDVHTFFDEKLVPFLKANKITQLFTKPVHGTDSVGVRLFTDTRRKNFRDDFVKHVQSVFRNGKQYPGIVLQKFAKEFETTKPQARMYFVGSKYMYTVLTKRGDTYMYNETVRDEIPFDKLKARAQRVIRAINKPYFGKMPMFLTRIDFGCCSEGSFFVNEIEFNGGNYVHMDPNPGRRFMYDKHMIGQLIKVIEKKTVGK